MAIHNPVQRFAVIGLGRFGSRLAANLTAAGQEVIAVDKSVKVIEQISERVTLAVAMDATDEQALRAQGIDQVDVAIVGMGDHFQARVLITLTLKQIGVPKVISRAVTGEDVQIMKRVGADEVVNPEDESADRWAVKLANPWFLSHFELEAGYSIVEIQTPKGWVGKTLADLHLRRQFAVHIVAIKNNHTNESNVAPMRSTLRIPLPDQPLEAHEMLVMMGSDDKLAQVLQE